jgi:hypothetical protein
VTAVTQQSAQQPTSHQVRPVWRQQQQQQ